MSAAHLVHRITPGVAPASRDSLLCAPGHKASTELTTRRQGRDVGHTHTGASGRTHCTEEDRGLHKETFLDLAHPPSAKAPEGAASSRKHRSVAVRSILSFSISALAAISALPGAASEDPGSTDRGLDEQVQEVKSEILGIAAEIKLLEERLLYPSETQVSVFVSMAETDAVLLDSLHVEIDGGPAANHIYSFKELEALRKGGIQRIYTGNLSTGEHRMTVSAAGKHGGEDFAWDKTFTFSKSTEQKLLEIKLAEPGSDDGTMHLKED
jgi:hypothetical protein